MSRLRGGGARGKPSAGGSEGVNEWKRMVIFVTSLRGNSDGECQDWEGAGADKDTGKA